MVQFINKARIVLLSLLLVFAMSTAAISQIIERNILANLEFSLSDVFSIKIFIDEKNEPYILTRLYKVNRIPDYLYTKGKCIKISGYGAINGFIHEGSFFLVSMNEQHIIINKTGGESKEVVNIQRNDIPSEIGGDFIVFPGPEEVYFLLGRQEVFPLNPIKRFITFLSGGHGVSYRKPCLVEIHKGEAVSADIIKYGGGKNDESFIVHESFEEDSLIHLLGLRGEESDRIGLLDLASDEDIILHYVYYNPQKKKTLQSNSLFHTFSARKEPTIEPDKYGTLSMDVDANHVYVVFNMVEPFRMTDKLDMREHRSEIYFTQSNKEAFEPTGKIGRGLMPIVKADGSGNVYVIWANGSGDLIQKIKDKTGWQPEEIIASGIDISPRCMNMKYIAAEFDSQDNLHLVYPSGGKLTYEKRTMVIVNRP